MIASPPPAPSWTAHAIGAAKTLLHLSGAGLLIAALVAVLWIGSSFADRLRRKEAAAQPAVIVAQPTKEQAQVKTVVVTRPFRVDSLTPKQELQLEMKYHLPIGTLRPGGVMNAGEPGSSPGLSPSGGIGGAAGSTPAASPSSLAALPEQKLPKLPYGGTALPTEDAQGAFSLLIKPSPRPWFQAGGIRRLGVQWDPILRTFGGFGEQDFFSLKAGGRAIVFGVRPFVDLDYAALPGQKQLNVGVPLTAAVDF